MDFMALAKSSADIHLHLELAGVIALAVGILILIRPKFLNLLVALYLIAIGLIQIFNLHI